jgi:hypothetical protein
MSPRLSLQFPLKNYDDLRPTRVQVVRILVVDLAATVD